MNLPKRMLLLAAGMIFLAACGASGTAVPSLTEVTLIATDIAYDQTRIEATSGTPIKITLQNEGLLEHDFSIMEIPHTGEVAATEGTAGEGGHEMEAMTVDPEVHVAAAPANSGSVEFTPSTPGEYEYFCTVEGHKAAGMAGTLTVK